MALKRIDRRTVPDEVFDQLVDTVLDGELEPGATLPAERQLAEALGVSRPTVREALQRLAHTGLVEVRQGGGTTVRDFRRFGGLDMLPRLIFRRGELDHAVIRSILETREAMGREIAGLAAERAGDTIAPALRSALDDLVAHQDPIAQQHAALIFWDHLVDAADSIVYRLMFNNLRAVYEPAMAALATVMVAEVSHVERYRALATAVTAGDALAARTAATELLSLATTEFATLIRRLQEAPHDPEQP
ncbi:FadR/GntR family transcriptional regulator [Nocardia huaxiensis]|uniref:FadR family transcriptional regulator n=1 Tax=Nocardia huaxiensis TaxID=2755382 RepID=A0A7D6VB19_9NOCA|nr:GntR family transcriptional regulator [Nocardia huaxiensis]QLY29962.1 FadR family transcriptional regulator [Nocardia huaxiensis]UFS96453.1 GntR family transcriptional regulator [Nocardia huaxiensis]